MTNMQFKNLKGRFLRFFTELSLEWTSNLFVLLPHMTAVQTNTEEMYIFDRGVDTKFLGVSKSGASIYTGNLLASFCIGSVPNGGEEISPH